MRVAAIYDIHGNLPALEAVLQEIHQAQVDCVVVGGDVLPGPMPRETLGRLMDLDIPVQCIYGNGEVAVLEQMAGKEPSAVPEEYRPIIRWTAEQLDSEYESFLSAWPKTLRLEIDGLGQVLFCHATPRNENECFTRLTSENHLLPVFAGVDAAVVVCGHTHMQFDRMIGRTRVVNAGSVGMPFGGRARIRSCFVPIELSYFLRLCERQLRAFDVRVTHKRRSLRRAVFFSLRQRRKCWRCSAGLN